MSAYGKPNSACAAALVSGLSSRSRSGDAPGVDVRVAGERRVRVVIEDLDARDERQQPSVDRLRLDRDQRP
jgi:hypothetical protein